MDEIITKVNTHITAIELAPSIPYELEIRYGRKNGKFIPGISKSKFDRIYQSYKDLKMTIIEDRIVDTKKETFTHRTFENKSIKLKKHKIDQLDKNEIRLTFNVENEENITHYEPTDIVLFRRKERYSKDFKSWRMDMTYVKTFKGLNDQTPTDSYELEFELILDSLKNNTKDMILDELLELVSHNNKIMGNDLIDYYTNLVNNKKFIGNQPKTLTRRDLPKLITNNYSVTEKADGERMFLFVKDSQISYLLNKKLETHQIDIRVDTLTDTLLDGEYVDGIFYAFDILYYKGSDIRNKHLDRRYKYLQKMKKYINGNFKIKKFYFTNILENAGTIWLNKKFPYELDGLIFTPIDETYNFKTNTFKWKDDVTLDVKYQDGEFYVRNKDKLEKLSKHTEFSLDYDFEDKKIHSSIIEIKYDDKKSKWTLFKERPDKIQPNAVLTAKGVIKAIQEKITIDELINLKSNKGAMYNLPGKTVTERKDSLDINYRKFHNYVKQQSLNDGGKRLLDLGSGKGGDLYKWIKAGYTEILAIDSSKVNIYGKNGLKERVKQLDKKIKIKITYVWGDVTKNIQNGEAGMDESEKEKLKQYFSRNKRFDTISCQFAIHYFHQEKKLFDGFVENIKNLIKPSGRFITTFLDSSLLEKILSKPKYDFKINNKKFYTIAKYYDNNLDNKNLSYDDYWKNNINKKEIGVKTLQWEHEIKEPMVYNTILQNLFSKFNFKLKEEHGFEDYYETYYNKNLSDDEKKLSFLHKVHIYKKLK